MFTIKIYERSGAFVQAVNEINDISFTSQINGGQGELRVEAAGILPDFSGKIVKIYETKMTNTSLIYSGLIGKVTIVSDSSKEYTEITAMGLAVVLWNTLFDEAGNYVITKNQEVSTTIKDILDSLKNKYPGFPTTPLAYYKFEGNANDSSGNGYNGTINGAVLTTDRRGFTNCAYQFNGAEWISLLDTPFDITTNVTYCFSVNFDAIISGMRILSKYQSSPIGQFEIFLSGNKMQFQFRGTTFYGVNTYTDFFAGVWYDIACSYNNTTGEVRIYINGVFELSSFQQIGMGNNSAAMTIGRRSAGSVSNNYFRGKIEYCVFYNRILTNDEILALKNSAKKGSGLIGYTANSIETTGITANLLFAYNKSIDAITTAAGVTEFSWYVDQDGVFQFHPKIGGVGQTTHIFTVGDDVNSLSVEEDSEEIVNTYVLEYSGGSTYSNSDATSQALYGIREEKNTNTQIADLATAMASVNSYLAEKKDKKLKIRITVNSKYNIESLKPGDLASVRNFSYNIESLQIQRVTYNRNEATLDLEEYNSLAKEILT